MQQVHFLGRCAQAYSQHPPWYEYHLTGKSQDLFGAIVALIHGGGQWAPIPAGRRWYSSTTPAATSLSPN